MAAVLDEIATVISDASLASTAGAGGFYLWRSMLPDSTASADKSVALIETAGQGTEPRTWRGRPGLQVLVRGEPITETSTAYETARTQIDRIWARLSQVGGEKLSGRAYVGIWPEHSPYFAGLDGSDRPVFEAGFRVDRAATISPAAVGDLRIWFAADHISGLSDGDAVTTWEDASGNSFDVTQATASKRPTYKTAIVNGLPVIRFDGTDDFLRYAGNISSAQEGSVFTVALRNTNTGTRSVVAAGDEAVARFIAFGSVDDGVNEKQKLETVAGSVTGDTSLAISTFRIVNWSSDGATLTLRVNGTQETAFSGTNDGRWFGDVAGIDNLTVGALKYTAEVYQYLGDIAEVLVYDGLIDDIERSLVETYLGSKYGITLA